jgi:hypothetical protein
MLERAAWCDKLATAQWLRAQGAQWPTTFIGRYLSVNDEKVNQCWSLAAMQWAIASGSGWLDWQCEDYASVKYYYDIDKQQATDVRNWAHANGCPCPCDHHQQHQLQRQ